MTEPGTSYAPGCRDSNNVYLLLGGLVSTACLISLTELQSFKGWVADTLRWGSEIVNKLVYGKISDFGVSRHLQQSYNHLCQKPTAKSRKALKELKSDPTHSTSRTTLWVRVKDLPRDAKLSTDVYKECKISVLLIEDHDLTRMGLRAALQSYGNLRVIGEAANATQGLNLLKEIKPDVAVIDIHLPDINGIELTRNFKRYQTETGQTNTKVLILTMDDTERSVLTAFAAGADSYYLKETSINRLAEAIQATYIGNSWIDPGIANIVLEKMRQGIQIDGYSDDKPKTVKIEALSSEYEQVLETYPLNKKELEILELIVAGCSNGQIAEKLGINVGTVKTHVGNILNKLCAYDWTQAAVRALRSGLVT